MCLYVHRRLRIVLQSIHNQSPCRVLALVHHVLFLELAYYADALEHHAVVDDAYFLDVRRAICTRRISVVVLRAHMRRVMLASYRVARVMSRPALVFLETRPLVHLHDVLV